MQHNLSENIRTNRKRMGLTQEQLAEAMGVTVGTVSKWENGNCVPDINLMIELADFFNLSMDALVGYTMTSKNVDDILNEVFELYKEHNLEEARKTIDKAIVRYPYNIKIMKRAGFIYWLSWHQDRDNLEFKNRAREIFNKALQMLNDEDGSITEKIQIRKQLAMLEDDEEKKLEILKQNNVSGAYDDLIAEVLWEQGKQDESMEYYDRKLHISIFEAANVAGHLMNFFYINKRYTDMLELYGWICTILSGMMVEGENSYLTRFKALFNVCQAPVYEILGNHEQMVKLVDEAYELAKIFDADPVYDIYKNIKFLYGPKNDIPVAYDEHTGTTVSEMRGIVQEIYDDEKLNINKEERRAIKNVLDYIDSLS